MHNRAYIIRFVIIMTVVVALILAGMYSALKPIHDRKEAIYNKRSILSAISSHLGTPMDKLSDSDVEDIFKNNMEQYVLDRKGKLVEGKTAQEIDLAKERLKPESERLLPLYIYKKDNAKKYILSIRGQGLWDAIWGNIALNEDLNTVAGVSFDHAGETPGLGAEIKDNPAFPKKFIGKEIFNDNGEYVSIDVVKGVVKEPDHQVDGITGATVTCDGVDDMLEDGLALYLPYLKEVKK